MTKFVSVPTGVEAIQYVQGSFTKVSEFCGTFAHSDPPNPLSPEPAFREGNNISDDPHICAQVYDYLHRTWIGVKLNQWIIRGTKGELHPCDPEVFQEKYRELGTESQKDEISKVTINPPTEPGFYRYDGGNQNMVFLLNDNQWYTLFANTTFDKCDWSYIEQALGVWNLIKIEGTEPKIAGIVLHAAASEEPQAVMELPIHMPGNNRNWETVAGVATVNSDGTVSVRFKELAHAEILVEMAEKKQLLQIAFDYRMPISKLEKINSQFQMEYSDENTLQKVKNILKEEVYNAKYDLITVDNIVTALQESGILFREKK